MWLRISLTALLFVLLLVTYQTYCDNDEQDICPEKFKATETACYYDTKDDVGNKKQEDADGICRGYDAEVLEIHSYEEARQICQHYRDHKYWTTAKKFVEQTRTRYVYLSGEDLNYTGFKNGFIEKCVVLDRVYGNLKTISCDSKKYAVLQTMQVGGRCKSNFHKIGNKCMKESHKRIKMKDLDTELPKIKHKEDTYALGIAEIESYEEAKEVLEFILPRSHDVYVGLHRSSSEKRFTEYKWFISGKQATWTGVEEGYSEDCLVFNPENVNFKSYQCGDNARIMCMAPRKDLSQSVTVPTTQQNVAVPTTQQSVAVPTTQQSVAVPTTQQSVAVTTTTQNVAVPTTQQNVAVPTTQQSVAVPTTQQSVAVPTTQQSVAGPTKPSILNKTIAVPTKPFSLDSTRDLPMRPLLPSEASVTEWGDWSKCPEQCKRSDVSRVRQCETPSLHNKKMEMCGLHRLLESKDCLDLTDCTEAGYYLATEGVSCTDYCQEEKELICSTDIQTGNSVDVFNDTILHFSADILKSKWQNDYAPYCNNGKCAGYRDVPDVVVCNAVPLPTHRRLCYCISSLDVGFGQWSPWSRCSQTCEGVRQRSRECFEQCNGPVDEVEKCGPEFCPVHGGYTEWSQWQPCNKKCGGGWMKKRRECNNPPPQHHGNLCVGNAELQNECNVHLCPVDAQWTLWSDWSACDKPCNTGSIVRKRSCTMALYGGRADCPGEASETIPCNEFACTGKQVEMDVRFDAIFTPDMTDTRSFGFKHFEDVLREQIISSYSDDERISSSIIQDVRVKFARSGSVIAKFIIYYEELDSYQLMFLQDSIEVERSIGKLPILPGETVTYTIGPDGFDEVPEIDQIQSESPFSIYVSWKPMSSANLTGYILFYRRRSDRSAPYQSFGINETMTSANLTWLEPGVTYDFRLLAFLVTGNGVATPMLSMTTVEMRPSAAPTNAFAVGNDAFSIYLEWDAVHQTKMNGIPLGYNVYAYYNGILISSNNTTFDLQMAFIHQLSPSTTYVLEVCAYNSAGNGPCERASATTADSPPSSPPVNVFIDSIKSYDQLTVRWSMPPTTLIHGDLHGYKVSLKPLKTGTRVHDEPPVNLYFVHASLNTLTIGNLKANTEYEFRLLAMNQYGDGVSTTLKGETCRCPPLVSSNYVLLPPYLTKTESDVLEGPFGKILNNLVEVSCGVCTTSSGNVSTVLDKVRNGRNLYAEKSSQLRAVQDIDSFTDLSFPIIGSKMVDEFMGYPFVSLIEHPGVVLIVKDRNINKVVLGMIMLILSVWPLIVVNLFMMILAGFLVWLLEGFHSKQDVDFSSKWITGIKEGWYWAFITQGTHGYGDFTPKKVFSRIFAMIWILVGLIMTSLIVGAIVTALTTVNGASVYKIYGTECGALNASFEEKFGTLRNGDVNTKKAYTTVSELKDALADGDIEIILLDAYTAGDYKELFEDPQFRVQELVKYPRTYGFVLSGDLADVSEEFKDYISVNEEHILSILTNDTSPMEPSLPLENKSPFDPDSVILKKTFVILTIMLIVFSLAGWLFAFWKGKREEARVAPGEPVETKEDLEHQTCLSSLIDLVDNFQESIITCAGQTTDRHGDERARLHFDRGESSLKNQNAHIDRIYLLNSKRRSMAKSLVSLLSVKDRPVTNSSPQPEQNVDIEGNLSQRNEHSPRSEHSQSARIDEVPNTHPGNPDILYPVNGDSSEGNMEQEVIDGGDESDLSEIEC